VKTVLHLVRANAAPRTVAERDWVVYLQPTTLVLGGTPHTAPFPLGPIDHDQVVALAFTADLVVTW
jgi:hypothetical protein